MTFAQAAIYSLVGILVVFFALILLMGVIKVLLVATDKKVVESPAAATVAKAPEKPKALAPGTAGDIKLYDTDLRDAAMIMAIVADELKKPLNELRFISIREVK